MEAENNHKTQRFEFGKNWKNFLKVLNEERINTAKESLKNFLEIESFLGLEFLDAGSGSGLFSLAAMKLGANRVHSFDYDHQSVECTKELKRRYYPEVEKWTIERGDVLDPDYLKSLNKFDIVYSWGVLHHTGDLFTALKNVGSLVNEGKYLYIAIYNDQGKTSERWKKIKAFYNSSNQIGKLLILSAFICNGEACKAVGRLIRLQNPLPFKDWDNYKKISRGMSPLYDYIDWVGGYPFEVAKPEKIFEIFKTQGFNLLNLKTKGGGLACNEYLFQKK